MIEKILIISLLVIFLWHTFQEHEILGWVGTWVEGAVGEFYAKPITGCSVCMTPWWGSAIYILLWGINWQWPLVVFAAAGLNAVIVRLWPDK